MLVVWVVFFLFFLICLIYIWWQNLHPVVLALSLQGHRPLVLLPLSSSLSKDPTIGFSASKVDISSNISSSGFCLLKIFLFIGSSICLKLALLIPWHVILNNRWHPPSKITCCKYVFLNIFCRIICIVCNLFLEVTTKKIIKIIG